MNKRLLTIFSVAIGLTVVARWAFGPKRGDGELDLPVATVEHMATFTDETTCIGRPKPEAERYASVQKGGRLETLSVKVGDSVATGQVLAVIDKTVNAANLKAALSSFRLAQKDYGRLAGLVRSGSVSRDEFDKSQSNLEVKRAELERAKQGVEDGMVRAPASGKVSVVVFKAGDKVPDGSRVVAIEAPGALQLACRIPTAAAARLAVNPVANWRDLDQTDAPALRLPTTVIVPEAGEFVGIDREVRVSTEDPRARALERRRVQIALPLQAHSDVAKLPSDAIVKRSSGYFALSKAEDGTLSWIKVDVVKRDASTAYVTGLAKDVTALRITTDLGRIDMAIGKDSNDETGDAGKG